MDQIIPAEKHFYLATSNIAPPQQIEITKIVTGADGNTYYHVSIEGAPPVWYNNTNLPAGITLQVDFGTTAPE